jgi:hypothetical protein
MGREVGWVLVPLNLPAPSFGVTADQTSIFLPGDGQPKGLTCHTSALTKQVNGPHRALGGPGLRWPLRPLGPRRPQKNDRKGQQCHKATTRIILLPVLTFASLEGGATPCERRPYRPLDRLVMVHSPARLDKLIVTSHDIRMGSTVRLFRCWRLRAPMNQSRSHFVSLLPSWVTARRPLRGAGASTVMTSSQLYHYSKRQHEPRLAAEQSSACCGLSQPCCWAPYYMGGHRVARVRSHAHTHTR